MVFKRFRVNVTARVVFLCLTLLVLGLAVLRGLYAASALIAILLVVEVISLISYVETTNRRLARLFESIRYGDFSANFTADIRGGSFEELTGAFNTVIERFRGLSAEKEENYRYLQSVVQHVGIGVIAFRSDGSVELINAAAKSIFDLPALRNIGSLAEVSPELPDLLIDMEPGSSEVMKAAAAGGVVQLFIHATELRLQRAKLKLVTVQDIRAELEEKEMEAWQNLIRVLTHEIKNSLTPISSLASSVEGMLTDVGILKEEGAGDERVEPGRAAGAASDDIRLALSTIKKRSEGLLRFTDAYRSLTNIKRPELERFCVAELMSRLKSLAAERIDEAGIELTSSVDPPGLELTADPQLVEHVLINLVLNAADALEGRSGGKISIGAFIDRRNRVVMEVADNGRGISPDAREKIFVPFFSTKKDGSGIGLSISRQIMRLHGGDLTAVSEPGGLTVFSMRF